MLPPTRNTKSLIKGRNQFTDNTKDLKLLHEAQISVGSNKVAKQHPSSNDAPPDLAHETWGTQKSMRYLIKSFPIKGIVLYNIYLFKVSCMYY